MSDFATASQFLGSLAEVKGALLTYTHLNVEQLEDDQQEIEQLFVALSASCTLRIFCANALLAAEAQEPPASKEEKVSSVFYFVSRYPTAVPARFNSELRRLLSVMNQLLPIGGLEIHDEGVVFRYMLLSEDRILDGLLSLDIIQGLEKILPAVFEWLDALLQEENPSENQKSQVKQHFQHLLSQMPILNPVPLTQVTPSPGHSRWGIAQLQLWFAVSSCLLMATLFMNFDFLTAFFGALGISLAYTFIMRLWQQQHQHQQVQENRRRQLQFSWQLLESEGIKFAYQEHVLEQHRHEMIQKLAHLASEPIQFPSDIVRLREQMLFLRHLQSHLIQRAHQVKMKRQELQQNRTLLLQERKVLALKSADPQLKTDSALAGLSSEDMLLQNLLVTLDYLDFKARFITTPEDLSPVLLVKMRPLLQPLTLRWVRPWHSLTPTPEYTWMLCLDQQIPIHIPESAWPRVKEVTRLFNRFLPLGSLIMDHQRSQVSLRYRFVRLRGDLSPLLVMEVMEVMATFGERLQHCVQACLDGRRHIENIVYEAEQEFLTLQR